MEAAHDLHDALHACEAWEASLRKRRERIRHARSDANGTGGGDHDNGQYMQREREDEERTRSGSGGGDGSNGSGDQTDGVLPRASDGDIGGSIVEAARGESAGRNALADDADDAATGGGAREHGALTHRSPRVAPEFEDGDTGREESGDEEAWWLSDARLQRTRTSRAPPAEGGGRRGAQPVPGHEGNRELDAAALHSRKRTQRETNETAGQRHERQRAGRDAAEAEAEANRRLTRIKARIRAAEEEEERVRAAADEAERARARAEREMRQLQAETADAQRERDAALTEAQRARERDADTLARERREVARERAWLRRQVEAFRNEMAELRRRAHDAVRQQVARAAAETRQTRRAVEREPAAAQRRRWLASGEDDGDGDGGREEDEENNETYDSGGEVGREEEEQRLRLRDRRRRHRPSHLRFAGERDVGQSPDERDEAVEDGDAPHDDAARGQWRGRRRQRGDVRHGESAVRDELWATRFDALSKELDKVWQVVVQQHAQHAQPYRQEPQQGHYTAVAPPPPPPAAMAPTEQQRYLARDSRQQQFARRSRWQGRDEGRVSMTSSPLSPPPPPRRRYRDHHHDRMRDDDIDDDRRPRQPRRRERAQPRRRRHDEYRAPVLNDEDADADEREDDRHADADALSSDEARAHRSPPRWLPRRRRPLRGERAPQRPAYRDERRRRDGQWRQRGQRSRAELDDGDDGDDNGFGRARALSDAATPGGVDALDGKLESIRAEIAALQTQLQQQQPRPSNETRAATSAPPAAEHDRDVDEDRRCSQAAAPDTHLMGILQDIREQMQHMRAARDAAATAATTTTTTTTRRPSQSREVASSGRGGSSPSSGGGGNGGDDDDGDDGRGEEDGDDDRRRGRHRRRHRHARHDRDGNDNSGSSKCSSSNDYDDDEEDNDEDDEEERELASTMREIAAERLASLIGYTRTLMARVRHDSPLHERLVSVLQLLERYQQQLPPEDVSEDVIARLRCTLAQATSAV